MFEICNKKLEISQPELLKSKLAIFIVEFDYDNRLYVGHTTTYTIQRTIRRFIDDTLDESIRKSPELEKSMQNSNILYITIKEPQCYSLDSLFKLKYETILQNNCYEPYGFNKINISGNKAYEEKKYIRLALNKIDVIYEQHTSSNARPIKEYAYEKDKGYTEVAEWPSITAAAKHYSLNASNIAACCSGRLNTAYKRLWRYSDL